MQDWNKIEKQINNEIYFLKNNILQSPYHQNDPIKCSDCIFRQLAILIVSGKIKTKKVIYKNNGIWQESKYFKSQIMEKQHGAAWHYSVIKIIENYFKIHNYAIKHEPNLHYGRSDLSIPELNLFIEVGTVNIYKIYCNLINMTKCKIIIIPSDNYFIEFSL